MDKLPLSLGKITQLKKPISARSTAEKFLQNINKHLASATPGSMLITWEILGLNSQGGLPSTYFDIIRLIDNGVPKSSVDHFSDSLSIPMTSIAPLLNMSYKTLTRKKKNERFDSIVSSQIFEIACTYAKAFEVFKDRDKVTRWFNKPNKALNGQHPFALLHTATGTKLVNQVLGRIQEGVYS
ncbi:MAG TPA: antitoxin Xre/MbcA/ParS toxin-binding domain-containing protein [Puia sp.]|nr:antitoxin Xre/MbcA/ParS toxin-binding domain-containing protein [Puia sp.]